MFFPSLSETKLATVIGVSLNVRLINKSPLLVWISAYNPSFKSGWVLTHDEMRMLKNKSIE